ncbi:hypothetical protein LTR95_018730 [Oleoguttula sp. CCFEE 5521]
MSTLAATTRVDEKTGVDPAKKGLTIVRVNDWQPPGVARCLAASSRNFVGLMEDGQNVLKYPHIRTEDSMEALYEEAERYAHLGTHENLVSFRGVHPNGLLFEYYQQGSLRDLFDVGFYLEDEQKTAIGVQIASCLEHLHKHNFIHCDLNASNVFIADDLTVKVGDLQGQLYRPDGTIEMPTMSQENAKSRHPWAAEDEFTYRTDIFAFGTLLYHLWHGEPPFSDLEEQMQEEEVQARYRSGRFPIDTASTTGIDGIIAGCWTSRYETAQQILDDMMSLKQSSSVVLR